MKRATLHALRDTAMRLRRLPLILLLALASSAETHPLSISTVVKSNEPNGKIVLVTAEITQGVEGLFLSDVNCKAHCIPSLLLQIPSPVANAPETTRLFDEMRRAGRSDRYLVITLRARVISSASRITKAERVRALEFGTLLSARHGGRRL